MTSRSGSGTKDLETLGQWREKFSYDNSIEYPDTLTYYRNWNGPHRNKIIMFGTLRSIPLKSVKILTKNKKKVPTIHTTKDSRLRNLVLTIPKFPIKMTYPLLRLNHSRTFLSVRVHVETPFLKPNIESFKGRIDDSPVKVHSLKRTFI